MPSGLVRAFNFKTLYEGMFKDLKPNGHGVHHIFETGDKFEGQFVDGVMNGQVVKTRRGGTVEFEGTWKDNKPIGAGR